MSLPTNSWYLRMTVFDYLYHITHGGQLLSTVDFSVKISFYFSHQCLGSILFVFLVQNTQNLPPDF